MLNSLNWLMCWDKSQIPQDGSDNNTTQQAIPNYS